MDVSRVSRTCIPTPPTALPSLPDLSWEPWSPTSHLPTCPPTSCLSEHLSCLAFPAFPLFHHPRSTSAGICGARSVQCAVRRCLLMPHRQCQARLGHGLRHHINNLHPSIHPLLRGRVLHVARVRPVTLNFVYVFSNDGHLATRRGPLDPASSHQRCRYPTLTARRCTLQSISYGNVAGATPHHTATARPLQSHPFHSTPLNTCSTYSQATIYLLYEPWPVSHPVVRLTKSVRGTETYVETFETLRFRDLVFIVSLGLVTVSRRDTSTEVVNQIC